MLPDDMSGEPVGVCGRIPFRIGQDVYFAVSLLEGLGDLVPIQPLSPGLYHLDGRTDGMPQADLHCVGEPVQSLVIRVDHSAISPSARRTPIAKSEMPNQSARQNTDQRVVQIAL